MSAYEALEAPGANTPFSLEPILVELEGGQYLVLILPVPLLDILMVWRPDGGSGNGGGGSGSGGGSGNGGSIISGCGSSSSDTAFKKKVPGTQSVPS